MRLGELEKGSFVSRYIEGFEGKENELVYIYRRNNFRSSMEEDAVLDLIIPSVAPRLSIDGELVEASETMSFVMSLMEPLLLEVNMEEAIRQLHVAKILQTITLSSLTKVWRTEP